MTTDRKIWALVLAFSLFSPGLRAGEFVRISCTRLRDMSVPRADHAAATVNGKLVVAGGHTTGFIPVCSAEILRRGRWRPIEPLYIHDAPFSTLLPDGSLILGGGYARNLGVGRTFEAERLDPYGITFGPLPCLNSQRARASAAGLPDGRIIVSGNWYGEDSIEALDGDNPSEFIGNVSQGRSNPYIIPIGPDDAIVFGSVGTRGELLDSIVCDRLKGPPFRDSLLQEWRPLYRYFKDIRAEEFCTSDPVKGPWTYLIGAKNSEGQTAALKVENGSFSLLPLDEPIPSEGPFGPIEWLVGFFTDKASKTGWLWGEGSGRGYFLRLDYGKAPDGSPATWKVYYTDDAALPGNCTFTVAGDGHFYLTGGMAPDNYNPSAAVWEIRTVEKKGMVPVFLLTGMAVFLLLSATAFRLLQKRRSIAPEPDVTPDKDKMALLFGQLETLMAGELLFREKGLGVQDVATRLGSNVKYVSNCVNRYAGTSFRDYLNGYRVRYSQKLMLETPERRLADIAEDAGFASEVSFFRNFKSHTGLTPSAWLDEATEA